MKGMLLVVALGLAWCGGDANGQAMPGGDAKHMEAPNKSSAASMSLIVTVDGKATTLSAADLQAMPQTSLTVKNGHSGAAETYTGVAVGELLAKYGLTFGNATAKEVYHSYVRAEGMDGYWVLYSASELEGALRESGSIVALTLDGKPLAANEGQFKMVLAGEKRPARWVRNLKSLAMVKVE